MSAPNDSPFAFRAPGGSVGPSVDPLTNSDPEPDRSDPQTWLAWQQRQADRTRQEYESNAEARRQAEADRQKSVREQQLRETSGPVGRMLSDEQIQGLSGDSPAPQMPQRIVHEAPGQVPQGMRRREPVEKSMVGSARAPREPLTPQGGGGSYSASVSAQGPAGGLGPIMRDYDEQLAGMQEEKDAIGPANEALANQYGQASDEQRRMADEQMSRAREDSSIARRHLDEIGTLVSDYAQEKIDPMKWYHDKSVPQKIATVVGAMLAGWQGGPAGAQRFINDQVDRSIALQQEQLGRGHQAIESAQNLYQSFLRTSENEQQAYDKTRAAMLSSAMIDVQKASVAAKTDQEKAQLDQFMAGLKLQRDMLLARLQAQMSAAGRGAPGGPSPNGLEVDPRSIATGSNGQQYLITNPAFSDDVALNLAQFGRLRDSIMAGQQVLNERQSITDYLPYSSNLQRGEAVQGAISETASKLASARGMPSGLQHVVSQLVPDFSSRFAQVGQAKIPEVLKLLDQYESEYLHSAGAKPAQIIMGPGTGKEAGKLKYYAKPGVVTSPQVSQATEDKGPLRSFQPGP